MASSHVNDDAEGTPLLPSLPHRRRRPPPVSAPPMAAPPLADPPSRPCAPRRSRHRRRHRCCWGGECPPSYPGNGFLGFLLWFLMIYCDFMVISGPKNAEQEFFWKRRRNSSGRFGGWSAHFLRCKQRWRFSSQIDISPLALGILSSKLGFHQDWYNNNRDSTINRGRFKKPNKNGFTKIPKPGFPTTPRAQLMTCCSLRRLLDPWRPSTIHGTLC